MFFFFLVSDVDIEHLLVVPAFDEDGKEPIALFCLINKIGSKTGYVFIVIEFSSLQRYGVFLMSDSRNYLLFEMFKGPFNPNSQLRNFLHVLIHSFMFM